MTAARTKADDLVGQRVRRLASRRVAVGGGIEEDPGQFEEPGVGNGARVDAAERGLGVGHPEVGRHAVAEDGGITTTVTGPQREAEGPQSEPGSAGCEVPRQFGQCGKRTVRPSGPTAAQFMPVPQTTPMPQLRRRPGA